jgi:PQQ-dependent catabolism-associated beta-propeller protein
MMRRVAALLLLVAAGAAHADRLYVTNERAGTVQLIDSATDRVTVTAKVGNRPRGLVVSPDGRLVYVAVSWWRDGKRPRIGHEAVLALDADTLRVVRSYAAGGTDPECVAVSPDGKHLYTTNEDAGTATIIDMASGKATATLVTGTEPEGVAASPDGRWVYVTAETSNVITVIDAKAQKVAANILVDPRPRFALFTADSRHAWITAELGGTVMLVDTKTQRIVKHIKLAAGAKPVGLALASSQHRLYVAAGRGNNVAVVDTQIAKLVATIPTGGERVWGIAITRDGRKVYAANSLSNTISVIDTATNRVVRTIKTDDGPWALAVR